MIKETIRRLLIGSLIGAFIGLLELWFYEFNLKAWHSGNPFRGHLRVYSWPVRVNNASEDKNCINSVRFFRWACGSHLVGHSQTYCQHSGIPSLLALSSDFCLFGANQLDLENECVTINITKGPTITVRI